MPIDETSAHHENTKRALQVGSSAVLSRNASASVSNSATLSVPVRRVATFHLGDLSSLVFTLPALHSLRESFPGAKISAVIRPELAPLLCDSPFVDEVLLRPKGGLSQQTSLMLQLRARHIDMAVAFSPSRNSTMLAWSSGAGIRVGFEDAKMDALLTHRVARDEQTEAKKGARPSLTIESYLSLTQALGCATHQRDTRGLLHLSPAYTVIADRLLREYGVDGEFLLVSCGSGTRRDIKEWPTTLWAQTLDELARRWKIVLVGAAPDVAVTSKMKREVVDLGGCTDLPTLAALCARARLFVGVDSGVMHLAAAMETSIVGIFGPTDWTTTGPRGVTHRIVRHAVECSPCLLTKCKWSGEDERKCLTQIAPDEVVEVVRELVGV